MMINMDMIGRLKQQEKGLAIMGVGTSQEFGEYFEGLDAGELKITLVQSGVGSDHTAFYNDSIPSLHFFTGAHEDYHTPSDVLDKIDPDGIVSVSNLIAEVITHFDRHDGQLVFQRTKDSKKGHRASFSVTLGVTPDFVTEVEGLGVDGVSAEGPADNAGILKGDVIIKMDNLVVGDIYDYMNGLSKYRKGDSSLVTLVRETDTLKVVVNFE
ncbi:MAG: hypothetical protein DRP45_10485 [Candidatus Zixiibacteriota bacterium]|nr:MAG: hypothetical protein DRP45_10485 [candidate division Zixibacteria bacterium]